MLFLLTKKKEIFEVEINQPLIQVDSKEEYRKDLKIEQALSIVLRQLEAGGCRERAIYDYGKIVQYIIRDTNVKYLPDITSEVIYL